MGDNGIDRLQNDEAARRLLQPDDGRPGGHGILPPLDPVKGVVEGTGMGAGGGNQGEDHDDDHTAGSNTVR